MHPPRKKIKLKLRNGNTVIGDTEISVLPTDKFEAVISKFCARSSGIKPAMVTFRCDGEVVQPNETVKGLELEDGDLLEVLQ